MKSMVTSHSGISSKRICGAVGWLITIVVLVYCTITHVQAPDMIDTFMICCMALLGIDSVTGIWKNFNTNTNIIQNNIDR